MSTGLANPPASLAANCSNVMIWRPCRRSRAATSRSSRFASRPCATMVCRCGMIVLPLHLLLTRRIRGDRDQFGEHGGVEHPRRIRNLTLENVLGRPVAQA